jgi:hypothetical protein
LKYRVVIQGIDPPQERTLQSFNATRQECRVWARGILVGLHNQPNAVAVIKQVTEVEVERFKVGAEVPV